jgi:hypothetical protein
MQSYPEQTWNVNEVAAAYSVREAMPLTKQEAEPVRV